jgi:hypothetical protein
LRNDNLVQIVKENFIPVALDLQVESTRQDAAGEFFRQINKVQLAGGIPFFTGRANTAAIVTFGQHWQHGPSCRNRSVSQVPFALGTWEKSIPSCARRRREG